MRAFATLFISCTVVIATTILINPVHPWLGTIVSLSGILWITLFAYSQQVDLLVAMGKRRVAIKLLSEEIERDPDNLSAYVKRARLFYYAGKLRQAVQDYTQALELDPGKGEALIYTELGQVYFRAGKYPKALQAFEAAYAIKARYPPTLAWLAIGHYAQRNFPEARIWWQAARRKRKRYARLNGTNWVRAQPGWLTPACVEAQKITALLNAHGQY